MTDNITPTPGLTHDQWLKKTLVLVAAVQATIKEPLSGDPNTLRDQAGMAEDYQAQVSDATSEASAWLDWFVCIEYDRIDKDLTIPRAKAKLDVAVMQHRLLRDKLEALAMSMRSRMRRAAWNS
jgi:hypothetical protein